jgi:hypothetical protein
MNVAPQACHSPPFAKVGEALGRILTLFIGEGGRGGHLIYSFVPQVVEL